MPRIPRKFVFDPTEVGVYHCINRCVRRAFLCGTDAVSGKCFEHRKAWLQQRLECLAANLAVDILGFSIMSNHIHVVVRNRPDVVAGWSDEEVARRWWNVYPKRRDLEGNPAEPNDSELRMTTGSPERLAEIRARLSSLPWFMRSLVEPIAHQANREDQCTGRFFEGRYQCQPILDEAALLACLAYVDLNPMRAGIATTLETSEFTSVYERIQALRLELGISNARPDISRQVDLVSCNGGDGHALPDEAATQTAATWLSPFELSEAATSESPISNRGRVDGEEEAVQPTNRDSNKGCLPMSFTDYLQLLDWTGRQIREDKRGVIPGDLAPILERLKLSGESWLKLVHNFRRSFRRAAGTPASLMKEAQKRGCQKMHGIVHSRAIFDAPPRSSA